MATTPVSANRLFFSWSVDEIVVSMDCINIPCISLSELLGASIWHLFDSWPE
ncbi:MAG: hypothetical protein Q8M05_00585 [Rhodoferax sp.]|uniref:hypothetical protein n=1 Tax=Rhodoferax sp. TaxID=50421 RepID=UPI00272F2BCF|nr:hypothetical protein [Rhodoferax sp.]MDP1527853.1 hypothetical protein [Rhodoferax sp.]MDP1938602.1 hypothetical protein [Hylemonella sp.]